MSRIKLKHMALHHRNIVNNINIQNDEQIFTFFRQLKTSGLRSGFNSEYQESIKQSEKLLSHFHKNKKDYRRLGLSKKVFNFFNHIRLKRDLLFLTIKQQLKYNNNIPMTELNKMYLLFINLKYKDYPQVKQNLRTLIFDIHLKSGSKNFRYSVLQSLKNYLLDPDLTRSEKEQIYSKLSSLISQKLSKDRESQGQKYFQMFLYEALKLANINGGGYSQRLQKTYDNFNLGTDGTIHDRILYINQKNIKQRSIFERIMKNSLLYFCYDFKTNIFFKHQEYDFFIFGKSHEKNTPFSSIDIDNCQIEKLDKITSDSEYADLGLYSINNDWINIPREFKQEEKVILEVNGPFHFINTGEKVNQQISILQEWKFKRLPLFNIHRYNFINSQEWEKVNMIPKYSEKYLDEKIRNAKFCSLL